MEIAEENGHIAVDMRGLLTSYKSLVNMDDLTIVNRISDGGRYNRPSIFQIPNTLYRSNKKAYLPKAFSFGPWHYRKPDLEATEAIKFRCLQLLFSRFPNATAKLAELETEISKRLLDARACYAKKLYLDDESSKKVELDDELFVKILVLDGCFIIELFRGASITVKELTPYLLQCLYHDLILLENQIPWFVLDLLFTLTNNQGSSKCTLSELTVHFFNSMFSREGLPIETILLKTVSVDHILDLLRQCLFLSFLRDEKMNSQSSCLLKVVFCLLLPLRKLLHLISKKLISRAPRPPALEPELPSASRLREAGVRFKRGQSRPILDVRFQEGVLEVPSLLIHDTTETVFRNLIAFEQCSYEVRDIVTSYAKLMDNLIDTVEDIDILCKNGIICNSLNPEDAAQFFNRLYSDTLISHPRYSGVYRDVSDYCQRWWPRWRAFYIHNYFGKPWAIFSQIFALVILALTILQVILK